MNSRRSFEKHLFVARILAEDAREVPVSARMRIRFCERRLRRLRRFIRAKETTASQFFSRSLRTSSIDGAYARFVFRDQIHGRVDWIFRASSRLSGVVLPVMRLSFSDLNPTARFSLANRRKIKVSHFVAVDLYFGFDSRASPVAQPFEQRWIPAVFRPRGRHASSPVRQRCRCTC